MTERTYTISTGTSRFDRHWGTKQFTWEEFARRCLTFTVTSETMSEYQAMNKDRQTEIKDVGGFVGGLLKDGRRSNDTIINRCLLTLDYDAYNASQLERARMILKERTAWLAYSTHKHTVDFWRVRIVIPLSRDCSIEEYAAVGRRIAFWIGTEGLDKTSLDPARLMFWASRPTDAPELKIFHKGNPLDVDETLSFPDPGELWKPQKATATRAGTKTGAGTARNADAPLRNERIEDPLGKKGIIGAFCRSYNIHEAIDSWLPGVYTPFGRDRYTYANGSTSGGAVVYNDRFLYSNHDTDPAGGRCCNAYDLVRIHLGMTEAAFNDLIRADERVARQLDEEQRIEFDGMDFGPDPDKAPETEKTPKAEKDTGTPQKENDDNDDSFDALRLKRNKKGICATRPNIIYILAHHPALRGKIRRNAFSGKIEINGTLPWARATTSDEWGNDDDAGLRCWLEARFGITAREAINDALIHTALKNAYHPVKEYLESLHWDGTERLDTFIIRILGAADTPLTRRLTRIAFTAAVARIFRPGCKYDYCITLQGPEGCGKSTLLRLMGGDWFTDSISTFEGKEAKELIQGKWLVELGELNAYKKGEVTQVKQFISSETDDYRPPYGRVTESRPRQCVLFGTTNEHYFLRSLEGDRRFPVISIDPALRAEYLRDVAELRAQIERERDDVWAEAVAAYRAGEKLYLPRELEQQAREIQKEHNINDNDPLQAQIFAYLDLRLPVEWPTLSLAQRRCWLNASEAERSPGVRERECVCIQEIMMECLGYDAKTSGYRSMVLEVARILNRHPDYRKVATTRRLPIYGVQKVWEKV